MRGTLVQEYREFYSKVCALIDEMPRSSVKSLPSPQISNRISSGLVGVMTAMLMCEKVHLFGFDMDLPVELRNNFKHYYNNITVAIKHDYTEMAEFFKVLHVAGFLKICSPFRLEDAPSECFFP